MSLLLFSLLLLLLYLIHLLLERRDWGLMLVLLEFYFQLFLWVHEHLFLGFLWICQLHDGACSG